jgi:hypothetical protein
MIFKLKKKRKKNLHKNDYGKHGLLPSLLADATLVASTASVRAAICCHMSKVDGL